MSDLSLDVNFEGSGIEVDAEFGYSNTRYVGPEEYLGETVIVPNNEIHILQTTGKLLQSDIRIEPTPLSTLVVDPLTQSGIFTSDTCGFSQVTVEENWDGYLDPKEDGFFYCRWLEVPETHILVVDAYGTGYRWVSVKTGYTAFVGRDVNIGAGSISAPYIWNRLYLIPQADTFVVLGGPAWGANGSVSKTDYTFRGEWFKYKLIPKTS